MKVVRTIANRKTKNNKSAGVQTRRLIPTSNLITDKQPDTCREYQAIECDDGDMKEGMTYNGTGYQTSNQAAQNPTRAQIQDAPRQQNWNRK